METNATRMCALIVGLPAVAVLGVEDQLGEPLRVHVETTAATAGCAGCGTRAWLKGRRPVELVDLAAFGRPSVLAWHKRRWRCPEPACEIGSWTEQNPTIAAPRARVTDRAGRWMCQISAAMENGVPYRVDGRQGVFFDWDGVRVVINEAQPWRSSAWYPGR